MIWLIEQSLRNESFWLIASLLAGFLLIYDERSWRGLAVRGFQYELQRFRLRLIPVAILSTGLPLAAILYKGMAWHFLITITSALIFYMYQRSVHDFSGRTLSGPAKRILIGTAAVLVTVALLPVIPAAWIPMMFVIAGTATSLSARNHLIFSLTEETLAIRQRLTSNQAERHNSALFAFVTAGRQSTDDFTRKAG